MRPMRVTHVVRIDAGLYRGGGEIQAERTREALAALGVDVHVFHPLDREVGDLVHFFGPFDYYADVAEHLKVPYVASPIFVTPRTTARLRWRRFRQRFLDFQYPKKQLRFLRGAKELYPLTELEEANLCAYFGDLPPMHRIPNGVEARFAHGDAEAFRREFGIAEPFILHTGTIDPSKNQLNLIRAAGTDLRVVILGRESDPDYAAKCRATAGANVTFLAPLPNDSPLFAGAYAAAHVFCLPSYREIFSLSALEATVAGAQLVLSNRWGGPAIWGDDAAYVDPDDVAGIRGALEGALSKPRADAARSERYLTKYSWEAVAKQLIVRYEAVLRR